ncbi:MAG: response regulator [Candidatus Eisenbacteria bacterium]|uniref:Response regulator n=1 Tax=Eiseniibacteriota bacterium TaxID=2212470 RepID=A0A9D6QIE5_UNCEI|nr:response regulator [Candidatus Eisenbacteria bacterium]MBI3539257.1 response regulator [Candidatus Eisenbacteria bacterium]
MTMRRIVAVVPDLFFAARIAATAAQLGAELRQPAPADALAEIRAAAPDLVIVDLSAGRAVLDAVRALKADPDARRTPVVGFYPHVDGALREAAREAGVDSILPRSAFTARLAALLAGELSPRAPD